MTVKSQLGHADKSKQELSKSNLGSEFRIPIPIYFPANRQPIRTETSSFTYASDIFLFLKNICDLGNSEFDLEFETCDCHVPSERCGNRVERFCALFLLRSCVPFSCALGDLEYIEQHPTKRMQG